MTKINRFVILYNIEGGNILRLWQAIIIISVVAGCLVIKNETVSQKQDEPSLDITVSDQISIRDTLSRDFRSQNIRQEVYYGKPEFFYVSDMLRDQNIKVYPEDEFVAFPDPSFGLGSKITIYRAPVINVLDGQEKKVFRTKKAVISDFLQEKNIELGDKDEISPNIDSQIDGDTVLTITRVSETTITEQITIDFKKIKQDDQNLEKGKTKIVQTGREGIKEKKFQVRRENGLEVERKLISDEVIKKPQDEISAFGTKPIISVRCRYNDIVAEAAARYGADPNAICTLMIKESNGNKNSINPSGPYYGLFQYSVGFWQIVSSKSGNGGDIFDPRAQIFNTAWAFTHGYRNRWP